MQNIYFNLYILTIKIKISQNLRSTNNIYKDHKDEKLLKKIIIGLYIGHHAHYGKSDGFIRG